MNLQTIRLKYQFILHLTKRPVDIIFFGIWFIEMIIKFIANLSLYDCLT